MKDKILILGIAPCLEEDLAKILLGREGEFDCMAVGLDCSDRVLFDIQHACTYHTEEFEQFKLRRQKIGGNLDYQTHSHKQPVGKNWKVDYIWPLVAPSPLSGSSAFLGCQAAVGIGYKKVILCGCPMQGKNLLNEKTQAYDAFQQGWIKFAPKMFGEKVKSMSGFTMSLLGYPTEEWLRE